MLVALPLRYGLPRGQQSEPHLLRVLAGQGLGALGFYPPGQHPQVLLFDLSPAAPGPKELIALGRKWGAVARQIFVRKLSLPCSVSPKSPSPMRCRQLTSIALNRTSLAAVAVSGNLD
jgi:hypothetical protein